ncbi:glucokinase [Lunasporangiospora selenospora]|uniref:Phosphotransferase n=1 Tax=Lunasporangiospora selenospora TaxID=979761 RepID=A0A9P6FP67_9FUNG|nr:glucokinase [Lunasporangiospora selenospora]
MLASNHASTPRTNRLLPQEVRQIQFVSPAQQDAVHDLVDQFTLPPQLLRNIKDRFITEMHKGLLSDGETLAMVPSHVKGRLDGSETGSYLTLDVGGTNLRVASVQLEGQGRLTTVQKKYTIDESLKRREAKHLFVDEHAIVVPQTSEIELGFTFSFPVRQTSIDSGVLISWTKGFDAPGLVGKDPAEFLRNAFQRRNMPIRVAGMLNDTVGTGSNGAYIEKMKRVLKWDEPITDPEFDNEMIINMEFGAFDRERTILPLTMHDNKVDRKSLNPGTQLFEKMIAGMYLGEITRNILLNLIDRRLLFVDRDPGLLSKCWSFDTAHMSTIEADGSPDLTETRLILESVLGVGARISNETRNTKLEEVSTIVDRQIVKLIVGLVGRRAARLSAIALASILQQQGYCQLWEAESEGGAKEEDEARKTIVVGVCGSLYQFYPDFEEDIYEGLEDILSGDSGTDGLCSRRAEVRKYVRMELEESGSTVGAALCAMLAK